MKKTLFILLTLISFQTAWAQEEEEEKPFLRSNEIGIMGGIGFNKLSGLNIYSGGSKNTMGNFGVFYGRTFVPKVKMRLGFNMSYMFSKNEFENGHSNYRSLHIEIPLQFHFVFNPEDRLQVYLGLGVSINRWMNTSVNNLLNGVESTTKTYNPNKGTQLAPIVLAGINFNINDEFSLFFQPEYRPVAIQKQTNTRLNSAVFHLGLIYHL